jgi:hypothetical protein
VLDSSSANSAPAPRDSAASGLRHHALTLCQCPSSRCSAFPRARRRQAGQSWRAAPVGRATELPALHRTPCPLLWTFATGSGCTR